MTSEEFKRRLIRHVEDAVRLHRQRLEVIEAARQKLLDVQLTADVLDAKFTEVKWALMEAEVTLGILVSGTCPDLGFQPPA